MYLYSVHSYIYTNKISVHTTYYLIKQKQQLSFPYSYSILFCSFHCYFFLSTPAYYFYPFSLYSFFYTQTPSTPTLSTSTPSTPSPSVLTPSPPTPSTPTPSPILLFPLLLVLLSLLLKRSLLLRRGYRILSGWGR